MEQSVARLLEGNQVSLPGIFEVKELYDSMFLYILVLIKYECYNDWYIVPGGWGNWKSVSVDHCKSEVDGKVKQIRYCENPTPKFGGDLCPEPDFNERYIPCNETNYEGNNKI